MTEPTPHVPLDPIALAETLAQTRAELEAARETIQRLSLIDPVTGLANRALLHDRLDRTLAQARRHGRLFGICFLNLDRFHVINETLGHAVGDRLLAAIADRLRACVRDHDTIARVGGDEFCVLLTDFNAPQDVARVAQRILDAFAEVFPLDGHEVFITPSGGISLFPADGEEVEPLLKNASAAMTEAKAHRNHFRFYTPTMNANAAERFALEGALRKALERNELRLHYQPQFDIETGRIVGAEALVRWQHPERGLIPPGVFIPIAELTGLILPIGEWILQTACEQAAAWQRAGHPAIRISVNLSARQFRGQNLAEMAGNALLQSGLSADLLEFELTESILMENVEATNRTLSQLEAMGVHLSIDDFGTGYSSLSYLKRFPIGMLKVDRAFVRDVTTDPDDAAIVKAIIALAHGLQLSVLAEGVETTEQLDFLREHGCDLVQGFLLGKPVPSEQFEELLRGAGTYKPLDA
ncbi:EAL domain-containing protein [bacterium]|nr:EAL domain-containing protein [bacterium]